MLKLTVGRIDCPFLSEAVEGGCMALQVGCSDHTVCAKLPWMELDLVPSLSTGIVSSATSWPQRTLLGMATTFRLMDPNPWKSMLVAS